MNVTLKNHVEVTKGNSPVVLGFPHTGTDIPENIRAGLNETGQMLSDTDWHVHELYDGLLDNVTTIRTRIHRYVIDVNRDPKGQSLYPGQNTTELCPTTDFDGKSIYLDGRAPHGDEIQARCDRFHRPYHAALESELDRIRSIHGFAILYDCHSIRSDIPFLFNGKLPDFNIGTNDATSCSPAIEKLVYNICRDARGYTSILNGRFKGGWTTRHYAAPDIQTIQMELAQSTYMQECPPWNRHEKKAARLRPHLANILNTLSQWRPQ